MFFVDLDPAGQRNALCTFQGDGSGNVKGTVKISQTSEDDFTIFKLALTGVPQGINGWDWNLSIQSNQIKMTGWSQKLVAKENHPESGIIISSN